MNAIEQAPGRSLTREGRMDVRHSNDQRVRAKNGPSLLIVVSTYFGTQ